MCCALRELARFCRAVTTPDARALIGGVRFEFFAKVEARRIELFAACGNAWIETPLSDLISSPS
jgi:hypothetical protein